MAVVFVAIHALSAAACLAQQRSLADLLLEAEEPTPEKDRGAAAATQTDPTAARQAMRLLIDERRRIVGNSDMFDTLRGIIREEPKQRQFVQQVRMAVRAQQEAKNALEIVSGMARGGGPGPGTEAVAAAQGRLNEASQKVAAVQRDAMNHYAAEIAPRYQRLSKALPDFFDNYGRMRSLLTHSGRDPARDALLLELEDGRARCEEFTEGHVLTGIMQCYAGKDTEAEAAFSRASEINIRHGLVFTPLGYDCCYGLILLGKADTLEDYIGLLRKLPPKQQTSVCCWLIGAHSLAKRKYSDAASFLVKAVSKAKGHASPQLRGEAAIVYLLVENKLNVDKAKDLLDGLEDHDAWQVQRAYASLAAEEGEWPKAVALIDACLGAAPPRLRSELTNQQAAYQASEPWRLPPPKAARRN